MRIAKGQIYIRWILDAIHCSRGRRKELYQLGIDNIQTMDKDALKAYLDSGECELV